MEFFKRTKVVRLRSQHHKYLTAAEDEESVKQSRKGSSKNVRWTVEPVQGKPNLIRLKSCFSSKYLSASEEPFLLGWTGKRVLQSSPRLRLDPSVEWEPIREGSHSHSHIKLKSNRSGNYLRGNGGVPPWNNSVTHDVPSRSVTQDWIVWSVDILEVDYESMDELNSEESIVADNNDDLLSRKSSYSCATDDKDSNEDESPAHSTPKSVRSNSATPAAQGTNLSPASSEQPTRVSPFVQHHLRNESQRSDSFSKLKSMLSGVQDLLDETRETDTKSEVGSEFSAEQELTSHQPHQLEVKMAKQTLKELQHMDFNTLLSSGRDKKLEKSINIVVADANVSFNGQIPKELSDLQDQIKSMRNNHNLASQELSDYTTFTTRRIEMKTELKKEAAKAHELEILEVGFSDMLETARAKRDELLKQLEEVENNIKVAEIAQADNAVEIEELISRIGDKSQTLRDMEKNQKLWQVKQAEAEKTLENIEQDWLKVKSLLQDL